MLTWSLNELSDILDVSPSTIRSWIQLKKIKAVKTCNKEGNVIRDTALFDFLRGHPKYMQIFLYKLMNNSSIGERSSSDVYNYLHRKGYLP